MSGAAPDASLARSACASSGQMQPFAARGKAAEQVKPRVWCWRRRTPARVAKAIADVGPLDHGRDREYRLLA